MPDGEGMPTEAEWLEGDYRDAYEDAGVSRLTRERDQLRAENERLRAGIGRTVRDIDVIGWGGAMARHIARELRALLVGDLSRAPQTPGIDLREQLAETLQPLIARGVHQFTHDAKPYEQAARAIAAALIDQGVRIVERTPQTGHDETRGQEDGDG